jgi:hypothetical protein
MLFLSIRSHINNNRKPKIPLKHRRANIYLGEQGSIPANVPVSKRGKNSPTYDTMAHPLRSSLKERISPASDLYANITMRFFVVQGNFGVKYVIRYFPDGTLSISKGKLGLSFSV